MKKALNTEYSITEKDVLKQYSCQGQIEIQFYDEIELNRFQETIDVERMFRLGETYVMQEAKTHNWLTANLYNGKYHINSECDDLAQILASL